MSDDVDAATAQTLYNILATEISPELVPADANGVIQSTEIIPGPYELQDFNLYYVTRYGFRPVEDRLPRRSCVVGCGPR